MLANPLRIWPTYRATVQAIAVSQKYYPNEHSRWVGNAFKHAIWNMLLAQSVFKNDEPETALEWAKKITEAHEDIIRNAEPQYLMDLHNNEVGRKLFLLAVANQQTQPEELIALAKQKADTAQYITQITHFKNYPFDLVYLR